MLKYARLFRRNMFIQTESTPNLNSLKFKTGNTIMKSGTLEFNSPREAMKSPLATKLFFIEGVNSIFFGPDFITITKKEDAAWQLMKPDIYGSIMDFFSAGHEIFNDQPANKDTEILNTDSETVQMIKELLETRIRPTIQEDGGDIEYCGFENGIVKLKLRGACKTCDSSVVTLKHGIENMLTHYIPEVQGVEQAYDELDEIGQKEFLEIEKKLNPNKEK